MYVCVCVCVCACVRVCARAYECILACVRASKHARMCTCMYAFIETISYVCRSFRLIDIVLQFNPIDLTNIIAEASGSSNMLTEIQSSISVC